jgi:hypothetical protein
MVGRNHHKNYIGISRTVHKSKNILFGAFPNFSELKIHPVISLVVSPIQETPEIRVIP